MRLFKMNLHIELVKKLSSILILTAKNIAQTLSNTSVSYGAPNKVADSRFTQVQPSTGRLSTLSWTTPPPLQAAPKLNVMMLGLRGFPNVQGGIEAHAEQLCPLLVSLGCNIEVLVRSPYQPKEIGDNWKGVKFSRVWAPKSKGFEALIHTFLGVLYAAIKRPDVLHIHAIGPALMTPLARLLGLKVVVTHHGPDYNRQKWGFVARTILILGEALGMRFSNGRIAISNLIRELVLHKHTMHSELIYNGVNIPDEIVEETEQAAYDRVLTQFDLKSGRYILLVSRLVPEKRHIDLINAFKQANINDCKLVLAGDSDHPDDYVKQLLEIAGNTPNVVMAGYQTGPSLDSLYSNAGLYVLPSSHEGLSISLLEALSHGIPVLASDIPANLEIALPDEQYFELGNINDLKMKLKASFEQPMNEVTLKDLQKWVEYQYDWSNIARQTLSEYRSILR
jgi:glycosyltransferase involved in cell wall biosynthesis